MDGASTPGTRARESQDTSALGMAKGCPRCARRWLVLTLPPAQQKSLPLPACSPRWSAAVPFPLQCIWLPLALISCALSPPPPPPSPAHPPRVPHSQAVHAPVPKPCLTAPRTSPHTFQLVSLMLCAPLHSSLQRPVSHAGVLALPCPPRGCEQRGGMEMAGPGWASTGHRN